MNIAPHDYIALLGVHYVLRTHAVGIHGCMFMTAVFVFLSTTNCDDRRLGKARERLLEATGDYAFPPGGQLDEITGLRKQTRVRDLQFKVTTSLLPDEARGDLFGGPFLRYTRRFWPRLLQ